MNKEEIFNTLKSTMVEIFEIDKNSIKLESKLYEDLEIDSIDAIDLAIKIKDITGKRVNPDDFKKVRTMQDLVDTAFDMYK